MFYFIMFTLFYVFKLQKFEKFNILRLPIVYIAVSILNNRNLPELK